MTKSTLRAKKQPQTNILLGALAVCIVMIALSIWVINDIPTADKMSGTGSVKLIDTSAILPEQKEGDYAKASLSSPTYQKYQALTGDDLDRQFIAEMIEHHTGAVEMAKLAQSRTTRQDIREFAANIVSLQDEEISMMKNWQKDWGYPTSSGASMEDHSAMGMADHMTTMNQDLAKVSGAEFDKAFLKSMLDHHQMAIDMAIPGISNAKHQELKDFSKKIIEVQWSEIKQMKAWLAS